eukprot:1245453-Rhodomonas_salina.6
MERPVLNERMLLLPGCVPSGSYGWDIEDNIALRKQQVAICLCNARYCASVWCYVIPGSDLASSAICLRTSYAMPSAELAYDRDAICL